MADPEPESQPDNPLSFSLYVCAKEITRQYSVYLDPYNLTYTQYIAMRIIWDEKQLSVCELGKRLYLDSGTLTPMLKKLEAKGYVKRARSKKDERKVIISATKEGLALKEKVASVPAKVGEKIPVSDEERTVFSTLIDEMMGRIMTAGKGIHLNKMEEPSK